MATFVLIHGAWHGSWCWKRVRRLLQERGHDVFTPTLTGIGERAHLLSAEVDLETHIADVINLLRWEELSDVVLCGHSYAGGVVTGVADRVPERIAALIYLDAFILQDGECVYDVLGEGPRQVQIDATARIGQGWKVPPIPAEVFNVNPLDRRWVDRQCTWHPAAAFRQKLSLRHEALPVGDISYVVAGDFPDTPFGPFADLARSRGWRTSALPCGHDMMLDLPEEVADLLLAAAERTRTAA
jgi:pimeloyl-ACP methyl ester carboxylesterase